MNRKWIVISLLLVAVFALLTACSFSATTAHLKNVQMAKDPKGENPTTVFGQTDTFYVVGDLANAPDDTELTAKWYAVKVTGIKVEPNHLIGERTLKSGSAHFYYSLTHKQGSMWPKGQYKVELYIDGKLAQTLNFEVK
jgi:hypothetical protein